MRLHYFCALCSFFIIGLGQIVKGEGKKGLLLLLAFYFALPVLLGTSLLINGYLFLYMLGAATICAIIIWTYSVGNALLKK
jgi:hypothetical protein